MRGLVLEDHPLVASTLDELLTVRGYEVLRASSKSQAQSLWEGLDLLVADFLVEDGLVLDLLSDIRLINPALPILLISGYDDLIENMPVMSKTKTLRKPFNADEFFLAIDDLLSKSPP